MSAPEAETDGEPRRFRIRVKLSLIGIAALLLVSVPLWAPLLLRRLDFFRLRRLEIVGTRYIPTSDIIARASVDTMRSVWDPTSTIGDRVKAHPGVQRVDVTRKLPGTIVITVTEYQPIALVSGPQGFRVFDERGVALPIDPSRIDVDAPVLTSPDTTLLRLLGAMRRSLAPLYARVSEVRRVGAHDLIIQLDDTPVRTTSAVSLDDLNQIEAVEADLKRRSVHAVELDLRFKDQIIARLQ
jgi:cell division protein FtsQ